MVVDNRIGVTFVSAAFCLMIVMGVARIHRAELVVRPAAAQASQPIKVVDNDTADTQTVLCIRALPNWLKRA